MKTIIYLALLHTAAFAVNCSMFTSTPSRDNVYKCLTAKAEGSEARACKLNTDINAAKTGLCYSACFEHDISEDDCVANKACQWHHGIIFNPCQEKADWK